MFAVSNIKQAFSLCRYAAENSCMNIHISWIVIFLHVLDSLIVTDIKANYYSFLTSGCILAIQYLYPAVPWLGIYSLGLWFIFHLSFSWPSVNYRTLDTLQNLKFLTVRLQDISSCFWDKWPWQPFLPKNCTSRMRVVNHNWSAKKQHLYLQSVVGISRHSALSEDRIWQCGRRVSLQGHRSVSVRCCFLLQALQCLCSVRKWFSWDHCYWGRSKPGCWIVGLHTRWELTTWGDFQLRLHWLLMVASPAINNL